jgi:hypothetical protein
MVGSMIKCSRVTRVRAPRQGYAERKLADKFKNASAFVSCVDHPGLSVRSVFHSKLFLCGVFVWARRAFNSRKRRFPARAVLGIADVGRWDCDGTPIPPGAPTGYSSAYMTRCNRSMSVAQARVCGTQVYPPTECQLLERLKRHTKMIVYCPHT